MSDDNDWKELPKRLEAQVWVDWALAATTPPPDPTPPLYSHGGPRPTPPAMSLIPHSAPAASHGGPRPTPLVAPGPRPVPTYDTPGLIGLAKAERERLEDRLTSQHSFETGAYCRALIRIYDAAIAQLAATKPQNPFLPPVKP